MKPYVLTIFWMIAILWAMYCWYWKVPKNQSKNNAPKVVFDYDIRHSTSSIESLEYSDNEDTRRKSMQKLRHEIKTRWPSKTSVKSGSYKSF